jgi:hypothetical protein
MTFFFEFSLRPFEVVEAEGGHLVKEVDFEAENFFLLKQITVFSVPNISPCNVL